MYFQNAGPKLTILKASAGSGKTFNLALEYITQSVKDNGDFRQVLAVTFTNKATREMKERIIFFLKALSLGEDKNLTSLLEEKTGLSSEEIKRRASLTLKRILHNYSHFAVSTIDSFNQKILRAFIREIGLLGNFNLELDTQKIVEIGVDLVLNSSTEKPQVKKWLLEFINDKLQQGKSWDIGKDLKSLAMELYNESFKIIESENLFSLPDSKKLQEYVEKLRKIKYVFENKMKTFGRQAEEIAERFGLKVSDFKYGKSGAFNYFLKIQNDPSDCTPGTRVMECYKNPENWYSKTSIKKDEIIDAIHAGIQKTLEETISFYEERFSEYVTADAILRNIYTLGLFSEIKNAIDEYKRENDLFLLSDTNILLKGIIGENEAPFIYEKSGSWYRNFLIDEFQDTSRLQWGNFKPLVANALAEAKENLIVGDAKQSIYRWRGGDWELIEKKVLTDFHTEYLFAKNLEINWRSSPQIVEFNNSVFKLLPQTFCAAFDSLCKEDDFVFYEDFNLIYKTSFQQPSDKNAEKDGYVRIDFSAKEENKKEWKEEALIWLKQRIDYLLDAGYSPGSMAILTRTKSEGAEVVDFLHEQKNTSGKSYDVISNESLLLKNFPSVRLIINSLRFVKNPESELALANVAVEYVYVKGSDNELNDLLARVTFKDELFSLFPEGFLSNIDSFRNHGLMEAVASIISVFKLNMFPENTACLMALQDVVQEYIYENTSDIGAFLDWWDEEAYRQTLKSPENADAIQVMTIHKSKGLEFDVVLIPFMNWDTDHSPSNDVFIWCSNEQEPFSDVKMVPLKYQGRLADSYFAKEYYDEKHKAYIDSLNLCYVAFTRAKEALFLHGELPSQNRKGKKTFSISDFMFDVLNNEDFAQKDDFKIEEAKFETGKLPRRNVVVEKKPLSKHLFIQNSWTEKTELKRRGKELLGQRTERRKQKINYGLLVHEILAELKDVQEADLLISRYQVQGLISSEEVKILKDQLERVFANPEVIKWFQPGWEVKTETTILSVGNEELRPDRVMIRGKLAIIIDFKTGREEPVHVRQLIRYRNKLIEMGYQAVDAFLLYIASNKVKQIA